jgi:TRAP-type C4-dicarboxylate transport system substrate-binding protein
LSPADRQKVLQNREKFNRLPPQRQQEIREANRNWQKLTPEQQNHIKNDVLPKWQQLPPDRQRAIRQRLGVLQNMPESARNQHLNDPNFTRGMSEEDKAMLRDLSHTHVGSPDPPSE